MLPSQLDWTKKKNFVCVFDVLFSIYCCVQVYNAYQTLLKGLASMLQVFHGIQKCDDVVDSKSTGESSTNNDEQLDDTAANVKQNLLIFFSSTETNTRNK